MPQIKDPEAKTAPDVAPTASQPGGPSTDQGPIFGIDLVRYATLMTQLAAGQPRAAVLTGAGLDEEQWLTVEKIWGLRLATAAQRMDTPILLDFEQAVAAAQRGCQTPEPARSMLDYAKMVAALERGTSPVEICAAFGIKLSEFFALQQAQTRRITLDPEQARSFRRLVEAQLNSPDAIPVAPST